MSTVLEATLGISLFIIAVSVMFAVYYIRAMYFQSRKVKNSTAVKNNELRNKDEKGPIPQCRYGVYDMPKNKKTESIESPNKNNIFIYLSKYAIILLPFLIFFGALDIATLVETFGFNFADILDIYLYRIDFFNAYFMLIVTISPIFLFAGIYSIAYISVLFSYLFTSDWCWSIGTAKKHPSSMGIAILYFFVWLIMSFLVYHCLVMDTKYLILYIVSPFIPLFIASFIVFPFINHSNKNNDNLNAIIYYMIVVWSILFVVSELILFKFKELYLMLYFLYLSFPTLFSFQFYDSIFSSKKDLKQRKLKPYSSYELTGLLTLATVIIGIFISLMHTANEEHWTGKKTSEPITLNLFINKFFESNNTKVFSVNVSEHIWRDKVCVADVHGNIIFDENTTYLPISKNLKFYFKDYSDSKGNNKTGIFAIEKIVSKSKYYYNVLRVSSMNKY
jgi:hypothetical protein